MTAHLNSPRGASWERVHRRSDPSLMGCEHSEHLGMGHTPSALSFRMYSSCHCS